MANKAAVTNANVLILGESGSGKEVLARMIHDAGKQRGKVFQVVNCQTFSENLLESELFGHMKGAFTGATESRIGRFEAAAGGTLLLDEIGDLSLPAQAKLLRALETKTINRIGSSKDIHVDFRLISATNVDLRTHIKDRRFREDLYYRISTIIFEIPPLRERKEDLPALIEFYTRKTERSLDIPPVRIDDEVMSYLLEYNYPGNIRELKNIIERMIILTDNDRISRDILEYFPSSADIPAASAEGAVREDGGAAMPIPSLKDVRRSTEGDYIREILQQHRNMDEAAAILGITRRHLANKIAEYGIRISDFE
jgi:DNA-binding NtrC family response regulator